MDLQGTFEKNDDAFEVKGLLLEFLGNRRTSENQKAPKTARKRTFLSLAFYIAPNLHTARKDHILQA